MKYGFEMAEQLKRDQGNVGRGRRWRLDEVMGKKKSNESKKICKALRKMNEGKVNTVSCC